MRCPNPGCHSNLQLVVTPEGLTNLECKDCSYGMIEDMQERALAPSSLLYPKPDFCVTLLWVFNRWSCTRWSDVLINFGIAKRLYATGMRSYLPDHEELASQLFEYLNLMEYRLGDALECSLHTPKMMRSSWMQYIDVLEAMSPEELPLQEVLVKGPSGRKYNFLEELYRRQPTAELKEAFNEDGVIELLQSMIPADETGRKLNATSLFMDISRRFDMVPHVAVEVYSKLSNMLAALQFGLGSSVAALWNEASSSN